jgi:translocation and assembly module TamB
VKQPDEVELNLTGESLRLTLPAGASQSVQPFPDNPEVTVSHAIDKPRSKRSEGDLRWTVTLGLLDSEVRGSGMRLLFSSNPLLPPTVTVAREVAFGGELVLQSGEFEFLGLGSGLMPFVLDRGLVRFRSEDPGNPYVNMAAHYDAPDGSTITLEYAGLLKPINRDKIRFRSTPPRTEQEIIALLLFGETGSSSAAAASSTGAGRDTAAAGGGGIAAYQLNALLGGIAPLRGLSTTFAVTEEGYTSTGVSYQISDTISAQAAFERREQAANSGTVDTTAEGGGADSLSRTRVGVDWRFYQDFLLRGSIGIGDEPTSGLDLMWQYRY